MKTDSDIDFPWFEILLGIGLLALAFQCSPGLFWGVVHYLDVRNWSWSALWAINGLVIVVLVTIWKRQGS